MRTEVLAAALIVAVIVGVGAAYFDSSFKSGSSETSTSAVYQVVKENLTLNGQAAQQPCIGFNLGNCTASSTVSLHNVDLITYGSRYYYLYSASESNGEPQNDSQPLPVTTYTVWFTNSSVYCINPAHPLTNSERQNPTCPTTPYEATKILVPVSSASTVNSTLGLRLTAFLMANSSGGISIGVDETNILNHTNKVMAADHWPLGASDMFLWLQDGCGPPTSIPIGYAILQGNYSFISFRQGSPLWLEVTPEIVCPYEAPTPYYTFNPMSDVARWSGSYIAYDMPVVTPCVFNPGSGCYWFGTGTYLGYWIGSTVQAGGGQLGVIGGACPGATTTGIGSSIGCPLIFNQFSTGVYTVVAGDEWGQIVVLHFVVQSLG